ncbi:MAG: DUF1579 domain-containing protein [Leptolyngbyaceae cyanobacterium RM2_2_4]|nr:DUF1579 domain-containing protein [Leptolyngbyaceae cyanobacterium SM1_4_3]NJN89059.1 DUF1579 domain-containing protein [Leptolyngbyaceae cyanobacterium SL_5_14]NJO49772.1 DUF1579 domain-containing protein [Leptolyngbyaceae cyanobacterium RM2_2_4]
METNTVQQESMMNAQPQKEHQWLQKLVGEWTYETEALMSPDQPSEKTAGTESVRSLGELWIVAEGQGEMPCGGTATTMMTIGYDSQKQRYVGTWVGSMMDYLWVYDGELNATENTLTLCNEGPSMSGNGKMAKYKDVIGFKDDDHRVMTSYALNDDGQWHQFMNVNYSRKK